MGGPGGSRRRSGAKSTTDDYRRLDVRRWARAGVLAPGYSGVSQWTRDGNAVASIQVRTEQDRVMLIYRHCTGGDQWKDERYSVRIAHTPCHLGDSRPWFICPAVGCGRRVAILYGGDIFACRHCYQLAYGSSREDAGGRSIRRADRLRARLGWEPGILNGAGGKPRWMRWKTFQRLVGKYQALVERYVQEVGPRIMTTPRG
jgi:hypothetical protein